MVEDFSSKIGHELETVEIIDGNHMEMARCSDKSDEHYHAIVSILRKFVRSFQVGGNQTGTQLAITSNGYNDQPTVGGLVTNESRFSSWS